MSDKSSLLPGFGKKSIVDRRADVVDFANLSDEDVFMLERLSDNELLEIVDAMSENVIGVNGYPYSIATNAKINGKNYLVPMASEESSVVAAASFMFKLSRDGNDGQGIVTEYLDNKMIAQIQQSGFESNEERSMAGMMIKARKDEFLELANKQDPVLVKHGGGAKDIEIRKLDSEIGPMLVTHLIVDTKDAMGANAVNSMAEALAPEIADITGRPVFAKILSNLANKRVVRAKLEIPTDKLVREGLSKERVIEGIKNLDAFAWADPYRATTHNKGIMNGVDAVAAAFMQDIQAIESGAHAHAATKGEGKYEPLSKIEIDEEKLVNILELPMAVGLVGGAVKVHPIAKLSVKIAGDLPGGADELGGLIAAAGVAQTTAAQRALGSEGIQKGHMGLHRKNMAMQAGATGDEVEKVVAELGKLEKPTLSDAERILAELRKQ